MTEAFGAGSLDALTTLVKHSATHQHTVQEEQGNKVHLDTLYQRHCHLAGCAQLHTPTHAGALPCSTRQLHCWRQSPPGHGQETNPATSALPWASSQPTQTGAAVTPCLSLPSCQALCSTQRVGQEPSSDSAPSQGTVGAQAQLYLCPCSVSCHCHGAPEPHRFQLRHRWEQQL